MMIRTTRGFTLMEILVVLAITTMAVSLGFQMLNSARASDDTYSAANAERLRSNLQAQWLRSVLEGLLPVDQRAGRSKPSVNFGEQILFGERFVASSSAIAGLTSASIS